MKENKFFKPNFLVLFTFIALHITILSRLIFFPYPELFIYPYLTNSGLTPYKQIFDQHFPGLMFFPVNLDNLGMNDVAGARLVSISIVLFIHLFIFLIARKFFGSERKALLANLVYLIWQPFFEGWVLWIDSFLPLFLLPAFYFLFRGIKKESNKYLFLAGLFLGISLVFKQTILPLIGLTSLFLLVKTKSFRKLSWFILGVLPIPLLMLVYFWSKGILGDFWYWTVTYNLTTFAKYGRKAAFFSGIVRVAAVFGFALFGAFSKKLKEIYSWLLVFIIGSLPAAFARFDFVHFQPALPFLALATTVSLDWVWSKNKTKILALVYVLGTVFFLSVFFRGHIGERIFFFDKETQAVAQRIRKLSSPGEHIFVYGAAPNLYQMSKTLPAGNVFVFQFPWFMMVREDKILAGIQKDKPNLVVADRSVVIQEQNLIDFSAKINSYLLQNYETFDKIGSVEFLKRKSLNENSD